MERTTTYFYEIGKVLGPTDESKIGLTNDLTKRLVQHSCGSSDELYFRVVFPSSQQFETRLKRRFPQQQIVGGGTEWFKITTEMRDFIIDAYMNSCDKLVEASKKEFGGPISIPPVELGVAEAPSVRKTTSLGSVQPHSISEAKPPISPYSKVGQKREQK